MAMYYNGKKVRNLYYNGKCITRLALGKEMTRLVEGDDFVRAQWLKGDGTAYIDTGIKDITTSEISVIFWDKNNRNVQENLFGSEVADPPNRLTITKVNSVWRIYDGTGGRKLTEASKAKLEFVGSTNTLFIDGISATYIPPSSTLLDNLLLFAQYRRQTPTSTSQKTGFSDVMIARFEIVGQISLIPCRLLRPIPAALDANGIARPADTCGMVDLNTGLFYGNVNTIGTFTVSDN